MTKKMTSPRHKNWTIYKEKDGWWMKHNDYDGYLVEVFENDDGQWWGEIYTEQKIQDWPGPAEWLPAKGNPYWAPLESVKREVVRRGEWWAKRTVCKPPA